MIKISGKFEIGMKRIFLRVTDMIRHHDVSDNSQFASPITTVDTTSPYMLIEGTYKSYNNGIYMLVVGPIPGIDTVSSRNS